LKFGRSCSTTRRIQKFSSAPRREADRDALQGAAALADEPQQIVIDIDSAVARRAAEEQENDRNPRFRPSFFEKLTNAIHLDYVLKIAGVGGLSGRYGFVAHPRLGREGQHARFRGGWLVGSRFSKIYR